MNKIHLFSLEILINLWLSPSHLYKAVGHLPFQVYLARIHPKSKEAVFAITPIAILVQEQSFVIAIPESESQRALGSLKNTAACFVL